MGWWTRNKRTVFTVTAITMAVATPLVTAYCTKKAIDKLEKDPATDKKDALKKVAPYAIAPAATTIVGVVASTLSHSAGTASINTAANLASSLQAGQKVFDNIVKETVSEEQYKQIQEKVLDKKDELQSNGQIPLRSVPDHGVNKNVVDTGYGNTRFKDLWSGQEFLSSYEAIRKVVNDLNERKNNGYDVPLNDWYRGLRIDTVQNGETLFFPNNIRLVMDEDHFYTRDLLNNPLGKLEFMIGYEPVDEIALGYKPCYI